MGPLLPIVLIVVLIKLILVYELGKGVEASRNRESLVKILKRINMPEEQINYILEKLSAAKELDSAVDELIRFIKPYAEKAKTETINYYEEIKTEMIKLPFEARKIFADVFKNLADMLRPDEKP